MTFKHITSRDNPLFKQLKKLADSSRERRKQQQTLLDGAHLLNAYVESLGMPELLIIAEGARTAEVTHLIQQLADVPTVMFTTLMFAELAPVAHPTGILALVKTPQLTPPPAAEFILLLEDIQDPGNLGSMLRTAAAAGVGAVYLSTGCTEAYSPKALRGGQGAQFILPIAEQADLLQVMADFAQTMPHAKTLATSLRGESLYKVNLTGPIAFVIGNEGAGLSTALLNAATSTVTIPINANVESLNAAAATCICLFERQRQAAL